MMRTPSHVLVGGLGFIGYHLAVRLREQGFHVVVLARRGSIEKRAALAQELIEWGVEVRDAGVNVTSKAVIEANPYVIYHLAGKPGGPYKIQYESHVGLLEEEIKAALETSARLVYVSSIAVSADIAEAPPGSRVSESHAPPRLDAEFSTIHSQTKALGEKTLVDSGVERWAIIRPGLVFGPRAPHREWRLLGLSVRMRIAPVVHGVPVVNVLDVAEILYMAGLGGFDGRWIHAVAEGISYRDVVEALCRLRGKSWCLEVPVGPLLGLGRVAGRGSASRLAWSIVRKRYKYYSEYLQAYPWRLEPVGEG